MKNQSRGFTFLELLIVLAIMALLAALTVPIAQTAMQRARENQLYTALHEIRQGIDAYKLAGDQGRIPREPGSSGYPPNLQILIDGVADQYSPVHAKIFFLRHVPRDPMAGTEEGEAVSTWGLRSYASEAVAPEPGDDIYDVYSLSPGVGLNGVPYKQW